MNTVYRKEPRMVNYWPLKDGRAQVCLVDNIVVEESYEGTFWLADEVRFETNLGEDEIWEQFDTLFDMFWELEWEESQKSRV